jgi:hypothetical protein
MQVRAYFDIGGTGARADAVAIWVCQFVGQKINVLDYYEAQGQELSVHLAWLRSRGWGKAWVILPHDGAHGDKVFATSYESAIREAGFDVFVKGRARPRRALRLAAGSSLACSSTRTARKRAARRSAGITKRNRPIPKGILALGPTTIGARTPRTPLGSCVFTTISRTGLRLRANATATADRRAGADPGRVRETLTRLLVL